jgi:uncharacterized protein DUF3592
VRLAFSILDLAARLLFALGVGCLLLGAYLSWQTLDFARGTVRTEGEVVGHQEIRDGDGTRYRPRVRFRTATGEIVTIGGQLSAQSRRFEPGTHVPLIYKVSEPTQARIALFTDNWLGACIAAVVGVVGLVGGLLVRRGVRREINRLAA